MRTKSRILLLLLACLLPLWGQCQSPAAVSAGMTKAMADPVFESLRYAYPVKKATMLNGETVAYVEAGQGTETIIFIHGLGSNLSAWDKNIAALSKRYRTIALDLPGYGKSSKAGVQVSMAHYAQTVLALMDELKLKQAVLAGHSMGGQVAMTAALQAPKRVQQLILAAPAGLETFTEQQKQLFKATVTPESIQKTTPEQVVANYRLNFHRMPADAQPMIEDRLKMASSADFGNYCKAVAGSVAAMVDEPVYERLPQLQMPTLILFGEHDALIPNKYLNPDLTTKVVADTGKARIKNSQVVLIPEAGHFLQFEKPEAFNSAVREFLE